MQFAVLSQSFDRSNLVALMHDGEREAGIHPPPIDMHRAGTALPVIAALLRSKQVQVLAQSVEQRDAGLEAHLILPPIDFEHQWNRIHSLRRRSARSGGPLLNICLAQPWSADSCNSRHAPTEERAPRDTEFTDRFRNVFFLCLRRLRIGGSAVARLNLVRARRDLGLVGLLRLFGFVGNRNLFPQGIYPMTTP